MAREKIIESLQFSVFFRDHWLCRYCLGSVFFNPTLKLLEDLSPGHGYYHPHSKTGERLTLFQNRFASADHIVPVADGGQNVEDNLVTACWKCNLKKGDGDPSDFKVLDVPEAHISVKWDGLASIYPKLPGAKPIWIKIIGQYYGY
jgi:hypothetical protein